MRLSQACLSKAIDYMGLRGCQLLSLPPFWGEGVVQPCSQSFFLLRKHFCFP